MTYINSSYFLTLSIVLFVAAGCASMNEARKERYERNYLGDISNVADQASLAFLQSGINVESSGWDESKSTYEILGYIQMPASNARNLVGNKEGTINVAKVVMRITKVGDEVVHTNIDTSTQGTHAMASSADGNITVGNPEEDIYNILDKKFKRQGKEVAN
ncbi:hypothetical protein [Gracilimonas sp.]|uniref:hypothetical protein n=1 Tax=Gracilimonas sp. TaxID=1974203 RepID=UPI0032EC1113